MLQQTYLHASTNYKIFIEPPDGFELITGTNKRPVYKLNKSFYGLKKQAVIETKYYMNTLPEMFCTEFS